MQSTDTPTCTVDGCNLSIKRRDLCYRHYMRWWRYGDPLHRPMLAYRDITGQRFGTIVAVEYKRKQPDQPVSMWLCKCDCGETTLVRVGDLNSGSVRSCGDSRHQRWEVVGNKAAHDRVRRERGSASLHRCVDCGGDAAHWSYDHRDEAELVDAKKGPYSLDPAHYEARCVPCHKRFDLDHLARTA